MLPKQAIFFYIQLLYAYVSMFAKHTSNVNNTGKENTSPDKVLY